MDIKSIGTALAKTFPTDVFFSGGSGMLIQYHDVIRPIYLGAIIKMIISKTSFGLPLDMISDMSIFSLAEWYLMRRYKNPLKCLDVSDILNMCDLDELLKQIMDSDKEIFSMMKIMNIGKIINVYRKQRMIFPFYVYSEDPNDFIKQDVAEIFSGINVKYVYGDLGDAIRNNCDDNYTYIFSDIEMVKKSAELLHGTCSHILLTSDFRYNYLDRHKTYKYELNRLSTDNPSVRIGTTKSTSINDIILNLHELLGGKQ